MTPPAVDWTELIRANIRSLQPYRCARDDYSEGILLDANENALGHSILNEADLEELHLNRYPDPGQTEIKRRLAKLRGFKAGAPGVFLGVGSDECLDLLMRITCVPQKDTIMICPPTYGMYSVCAIINDVGIVKVPLDCKPGSFQPQVDQIMEELSSLKPPPKLLFLTSPGNPTSCLIPPDIIRPLLEHPTWRGLVVVDEAYIDFADTDGSNKGSAISLLNEGYKNLIVMQTLSKGFGLAGIRLGCSFSDPELAQFLSNTKAPYNISTPTADLALKALSEESLGAFHSKVAEIVANRAELVSALQSPELQSKGVGPIIGGTDGNFILVQIQNAQGQPDNTRAERLYKTLAESNGVVVRFRGKEMGCKGCIRITVGTKEEIQVAIRKISEVLDQL